MLLGKEFLSQAAELMKSQISMDKGESENAANEAFESEDGSDSIDRAPKTDADKWESLEAIKNVAIKPTTSGESSGMTFKTTSKRIDVYWTADDGGLVLMLPHLLRQAGMPPWVCEYTEMQ